MHPGDDLKVAIVGATGMIGVQLLELIAARGFPHRELKLLATESGAATTVEAAGEEHLVETFTGGADLSGVDIAFLALPASKAAEIIAGQPGPILIDLSAASRSPNPQIALAAPGFTSQGKVEAMRNASVIAPPHPAAHALAACLKALGVHDGFAAATVMLGASAGGREAVATAVEQTADLLNARLDLEEGEVQRGFNVFVRENERSLAMTIEAQTAALLEQCPQLAVQVVAAPIPHGCGLAIDIPWREDGNAREMLRGAPGLLLADEGEPLGTLDAAGEEAILVTVEERPATLSLWCVFDNSRLAALDALWIAERIVSSTPPD
ncbi:MAG TPA: hypothetical protein VMT58_05430 [Candidatus Binataceae bacterium]|nr:hypothetical protein [Candidatus Binataceae bacterium]